jgi:hypothetical protein
MAQLIRANGGASWAWRHSSSGQWCSSPTSGRAPWASAAEHLWADTYELPETTWWSSLGLMWDNSHHLRAPLRCTGGVEMELERDDVREARCCEEPKRIQPVHSCGMRKYTNASQISSSAHIPSETLIYSCQINDSIKLSIMFKPISGCSHFFPTQSHLCISRDSSC